MEITNNAPLIHNLLQAVNTHNLDRVARFYAPTYEGLDVSRAQRCHGPEGARIALCEWLDAFPDLQLTTRKVLAQPGQMAFYWTTTGTHRGVFLSVPPTGCSIEVCGFSMLTIREEKIVRGLHLWDMAGLLRAMRLLPDLPGNHTASQAALLSGFLMNLNEEV